MIKNSAILKKKESRFCSLLLILFLLGTFFAKVLPIGIFVGNAIVGIIGLTLLFYVCITEKNSPIPVYILLYCIMAMTVMSVSMAYNGNSSPEDLAWIWVYAGPVSVLLTKQIDYRYFKFAFYAVTLYIFIQVLTGVNEANLFTSGSRNAISANIIFFAVLLYLFQYNQTGHIDLMPSVLVLAICVYGSGRSGVLVGLALFLLVLLSYLLFEKKMAVFKVALVAVIAVCAYILIVNIFGDYLLYLDARFDREGLESSRTIIWSEYFSAIFSSVGDMVFGAPTTSSTGLHIAYYGGNLHNAFLMLHAKFGIAGFLFIFLGILLFTKEAIRRRDFIYGGMLAILIFRSMFDWTAFTGQYDLVFLYIIFNTLLYRKSEKTSSRLTIMPQPMQERNLNG